MKLVTYIGACGRQRAGVVLDDRVFDLAGGAATLGARLPGGLVPILALEEPGMTIVRQVAAAAAAGHLAGWPEEAVTLTAAVPDPPTIFLLAGNYQSHLTESGAPPVDKSRITPRVFMKPGAAVIGTGVPIDIPPDSDTLDYEIEIAVVIGSGGRFIAPDRAEEHVAGYVVFNDISARSLFFAQGRQPREWDDFFDWLLGKWCDGFAAVGPYLVTRDEAGDPSRLAMELRVNGVRRQHSSAGEMIFTIPEAIAFISRFVSLRPGDLICMGTPGGVGDTTATYLQPGDVVEAEIERLGTLVNSVRAARVNENEALPVS